MQPENKWALFDFCETIVDFQTADAFVEFVCKKKDQISTRVSSFIIRVLNKIKLFKLIDFISGNNLYLVKQCKLMQLRGVSKDELERLSKEFFIERIEPRVITVIMNQIIRRKEEGYRILIVSGGYSIYIKWFVEKYGLDGLIANEIQFSKGVCTGRLTGVNCMNENKPKLLNEYFQKVPAYSEAYSDSITDIPFLSWAQKGIVVSKNIHQKWTNSYGFSEIIWADKQ